MGGESQEVRGDPREIIAKVPREVEYDGNSRYRNRPRNRLMVDGMDGARLVVYGRARMSSCTWLGHGSGLDVFLGFLKGRGACMEANRA